MLAVAIVESDLRERAINVSKPGVYDIGLMGVRCVTVFGAHARADWRSVSVVTSTMETQTPRGRCTNGPARGLYAHQLFNGPTNIRTAERVLYETHGGSLRGYNGGTREHGYAKRIHAIEAALGGVLVPGVTGRTAKLCRQIVEAVKGAPRT